MKKFVLTFALMLLVASTAFAQKNPIEIEWLIEDSAGINIWNIGAGGDIDTSEIFNIARLPETGLGFHISWNATTADTGSLVLLLYQCAVAADYGSFASFSDTAAASMIGYYTYVDSLNFGAAGAPNNVTSASGRGSISWNPTLVGPATRAFLVVKRNSGTAIRSISIAAIKEY